MRTRLLQRRPPSMRGARLLHLALVGSTGCVALMLPAVPPVGRSLPVDRPGEWDIALDVGIERTASAGVTVTETGKLSAAEAARPSWPSVGLNVRFGILDGLGAELRLGSSFILPIPPVPIPNGVSLAPIIRLAEFGPQLRLHASPRFVAVVGTALVAATSSTSTNFSGWGFDLPVSISWVPADWFALGGTLYGTGYAMHGVTKYRDSDDKTSVGTADWLSAGAGATVNLIFTLGALRLVLGGGIEGRPGHPSCPPENPACVIVPYPQAGISIGAAWK